MYMESNDRGFLLTIRAGSQPDMRHMVESGFRSIQKTIEDNIDRIQTYQVSKSFLLVGFIRILNWSNGNGLVLRGAAASCLPPVARQHRRNKHIEKDHNKSDRRLSTDDGLGASACMRIQE